MAKLSKINLTLLIIIGCVGLVLGIKYLLGGSIDVGKGEANRTKGSPKAPIQIIEYIDFQCPACAKGAIYLKQCFEKYPKKLHIEMRYYPLGMHPHAFQSALYAHCASAQGKFWPYHDFWSSGRMNGRTWVTPSRTFKSWLWKPASMLKN